MRSSSSPLPPSPPLRESSPAKALRHMRVPSEESRNFANSARSGGSASTSSKARVDGAGGDGDGGSRCWWCRRRRDGGDEVLRTEVSAGPYVLLAGVCTTARPPRTFTRSTTVSRSPRVLLPGDRVVDVAGTAGTFVAATVAAIVGVRANGLLGQPPPTPPIPPTPTPPAVVVDEDGGCCDRVRRGLCRDEPLLTPSRRPRRLPRAPPWPLPSPVPPGPPDRLPPAPLAARPLVRGRLPRMRSRTECWCAAASRCASCAISCSRGEICGMSIRGGTAARAAAVRAAAFLLAPPSAAAAVRGRPDAASSRSLSSSACAESRFWESCSTMPSGEDAAAIPMPFCAAPVCAERQCAKEKSSAS